MYDIYYAHHQWKYHTREEEYELDLIRKYFPNATIFNPSTDLDMKIVIYENLVMRECLKAVDSSDIVIFSSVNGVISSGVYREIMRAREKEKPCFYLYYNKLQPIYEVAKLVEGERSDRLYALVKPEVNFSHE